MKTARPARWLSSVVVALGLVVATAGAASAQTVSQTTSNAVVAGNSASCNLFTDNNNEVSRVIDLSTEDAITRPFHLTSISFGIEQADDGPFLDDGTTYYVQAFEHPKTSAPPSGTSWGLGEIASNIGVGSATVTNDRSGTVVTVPIDATLQDPVHDDLVLTVNGSLSGDLEAVFIPGSNSDGETAPGYIYAPSCGYTSPTSAAAIKNGMDVVLYADGDEEPPADRDGDGVPDENDDCPRYAGSAAHHGCPLVPRTVRASYEQGKRTGRLSGKVVSSVKACVAAAPVTIFRKKADGSTSRLASILTGKKGGYHIRVPALRHGARFFATVPAASVAPRARCTAARSGTHRVGHRHR